MAHDAASGQGSNSAQLRQLNQRAVLSHLRRLGEASKADIARLTGLTANAVGVIVRQLAGDGLVIDQGKKFDGRRGQPATMLTLNPDGAYAIGVRIDRRMLETVLVNFGGTIIARHIHDRPLPRPEEALDLLAGDIGRCLAGLDDAARRRVVGIGIAQPFNLGSWLRELQLAEAPFRLWDSIDVAAELHRRTGLAAMMENDGTAGAIAELFYGAGRDTDDFLYFFIGPAVGGGVVLAGQVLHGVRNNAGDLAMMPVPPSRLPSVPPPANSAFELLITRASLNGLVRHLAWHGRPVAERADLAAAMADRPQAVNEWLADCCDALAGPIYAAVAILDVPTVVIDSDLDRPRLAALLQLLEQKLAAAVPEACRPPHLRPGRFGADAGALGAATLPFHLSYGPRSTFGPGPGAGFTDEASHVAAQ